MELAEGLQVKGSPSRVSQVFSNLLINAAQAMSEWKGPRREIRVSSHLLGDRALVDHDATERVPLREETAGHVVERRHGVDHRRLAGGGELPTAAPSGVPLDLVARNRSVYDGSETGWLPTGAVTTVPSEVAERSPCSPAVVQAEG